MTTPITKLFDIRKSFYPDIIIFLVPGVVYTYSLPFSQMGNGHHRKMCMDKRFIRNIFNIVSKRMLQFIQGVLSTYFKTQ